MPNVHDLTGQRFGRLVVIERYHENTKHKRAQWICKCDCGGQTVTSGNCLLKGHTKSCGCAVHDNKPLLKHGLSKTRIHYIWRAMKDRCYNPKNNHYKSYGERGITICDEWKSDFMAFYKWAMQNGYSDDLTIDRIENDKGYSPDNCRWSTGIEQANNKSDNKLFAINGEVKSLAQWCRELGLNYSSVQSRLNHGYSFEEAISPDFKKKDIFKNDRNREIYKICKERGVPYKFVAQRISVGWDLERALTEPSRHPKKK